MKRKSVIIAFLALLTIFPLLAQAAPVGKFTAVDGNVDVTPPGKEAVMANLGDQLNAGDIIRTKSKSKCEVTFLDGSILRLAENSRLRVSEFSHDNGKRSATLDLFRGKIHNVVKTVAGTTGSKYEVRTPTAVCGVRGTQFYNYHQAGVSGAVVTDGTVYAYSANNPTEVRTVNAGQAMVVTDPNVAPTVRAATVVETEQHQKDTTPAEKPKTEAKKEEGNKTETAAAPTGGISQGSGTPSSTNKLEEQLPAATLATLPALAALMENMPTTTTQTPTVQPPPTTPIVPPTTVNKTPPKVTLASTPPERTNNAAATFTAASTETAVTYQYSLDGGAVTPAADSTITLPALSDGPHTITVTATDPAGNVSEPVTHTWTVDTAKPVITLSGAPANSTNATTAAISVTTNEEATLTYTFNGTSVTSPNLLNLPQGSNTFTVTATDAVGNSDTQTISWTTDLTPPAITLSGLPVNDITMSNLLSIGVSASEPVTYSYKLNGTSLSSPNLSNLPEGTNTFTVTATDAAGNTTTKTYTWHTDYTAPPAFTASINEGEAAPTEGHFGFGSWNFDSSTFVTLPAAANQASFHGQLASTPIYDVQLKDYVGDSFFKGTPPTLGTTYPAASFQATGAYDTAAAGRLFAAKIVGGGSDFNLSGDSNGFFNAIYGGVRTGDYLSGEVVGIYLRPEGNNLYEAGWLTSGTVTASLFPQTGTWQTTGDNLLTATRMSSGLNSGTITVAKQDETIAQISGNGGILGTAVLTPYGLVDADNPLHSLTNWGVWTMAAGGTFPSTTPASSWQAVAGWQETNYHDSYGIVHLDGTAETGQISGSASGLLLSPEHLVTISGRFAGVYPASQPSADQIGAWESVGSGTFTETPLAFRGYVNGGLLYYQEYPAAYLAPQENQEFSYSDYGGGYGGFASGGYAQGLIGGTGALLGDAAVPAVLMGSYSSWDGYREPALIYGSGWYFSGTTGEQTPADPADDGAFNGYIVGLWNDGRIERAKALALAIGADGQTGIVRGNLTGSYYPGLLMWEATGNLAFSPMGHATDLRPADITSSLRYGSLEGTMAGTAADGFTIRTGHLQSDLIGIAGQNWGIWNMGLGGTFAGASSGTYPLGGTISADFGQEYYNYGYWLSKAVLAWNDDPNYPGRLGISLDNGLFITETMIGSISTAYGGFMGSNADPVLDPEGNVITPGTWQAAGVGTYEGVPTDFGGYWNHSTLYNDFGYPGWNSSEEGGVFGFQERPEGKYYFLAIGEYYDYGYGMAAFGGPYIWSGSLSNHSQTPDRYMEAFTGGIWQKANPGDPSGTLAGYTAALYYTEDGKVGLIKGDLTGNFYEMQDYDYERNGLWQVTSGAGGLTNLDTTASLPEDFNVSHAYIGSESLYASAAGSFVSSTGENAGTVRGSYYNGKTKFITYDLYDALGNWIETKSLPFGIYNLKLGEGSYNYYSGKPTGNSVPWKAKIGSDGYFGYDYQDYGYWLADVTGTWNEYQAGAAHGTINGALSGQYVTSRHMGTIGGPLYGLYTDDTDDAGTHTGAGTWIGLSVGTYEGTATDFGGEWYNSTLYNDQGYMSWNSEGEDQGAFGFKKRTDGKYGFLAIGEYYDYGYGAAGLGGPYIWSGSLWHEGQTGNRYLEGFTGGLRQKTDPGNTYGTLNGYAAALYYTEGGQAGLIKGDLTGAFYEIDYDSYWEEIRGLWKAESTASGLVDVDKTASLPGGFDVATAYIGDDSLYAYAAGSFVSNTGGNVGTVRGEYYNGRAKFITYNLYDTFGNWIETKSLPFGIYNLKLGEGASYNYYSGKPAGTSVAWNAKIGSDGYFGYNYADYGYWLADITGTWNEDGPEAGRGTITGALSGSYLTATHMGTIGGPLYGLYTEDAEIAGDGTWIGLSVGTFEGIPLKFVSNFQLSELAWNASWTSTGLYTLLGGINSLWTPEAATFGVDTTMIGRYGGNSGLWAQEYGTAIVSHNFENATDSTYDGGSYEGYISVAIDDTRAVRADLLGRYVAPDESSGYLKGTLNGDAYPEPGLFGANGSIKRIPMTDPTGDWGLWQTSLNNASLETSGPPPAAFSWVEHLVDVEVDKTWWENYQVDNVQNVSGAAAITTWTGSLAAARADWVNATTGVIGGEINGLYDPTAATWKVIAQGAYIETTKFMAMAAETAGRSTLAALNIPCIQVGQASLSGSGNNLTVDMNNVTFFANSVGTAPRIWATNGVNGAYTAAPIIQGQPGYQAVPLSGGGLQANFEVRNWAGAGGTWGANITGGAGTLSGGGYNGTVNFTGGAAGNIGTGTFSGTAAGIVKP